MLIQKTIQTITLVLACCTCGDCLAQTNELTQNPLRAANSSERVPAVPARCEVDPNARPLKSTTSINGLLEPLESATNSLAELAGAASGKVAEVTDSVQRDNEVSPVRRDGGFLRTAYNEQIATQAQDPDLQLDERRRIGLPFEIDALPSDENIFGMAGNIAMNCLFVLSIGIAFILVARRRMSPGSKNGNTTEKHDELSVKHILKIDSKNTLRIIGWRNCDVLVASDNTGIKSVNVLSSSFQDSLSVVETESEELNELVKKFLVKES